MKPDNLETSDLAEQLNEVFVRPSGREIDEMRNISFKTDIAPHAWFCFVLLR